MLRTVAKKAVALSVCSTVGCHEVGEPPRIKVTPERLGLEIHGKPVRANPRRDMRSFRGYAL